jgi:hypothetical protein
VDRIKYIVGWVLAKLFPRVVDDVCHNFTIPNWGQGGHRSGHPIVRRSIRFYLASKAKQQERSRPGGLEALHKEFWSKTDTYFSITKNRTEEVHIPAYNDIVQRLRSLLADKNIQTVCEFGVGDGRWLNHLSQQWVDVKKFIGIDISESQIEENCKTYRHLTFIQSGLLEWAETSATENTLYHTCGGVLEYLSEESVSRLFQILRQRAKGSMIFFIEPLYGNYDLTKDTASRIIGSEHSYTHNYVHLLRSAGIEVISHEERKVMGFRNLIVLAYNGR